MITTYSAGFCVSANTKYPNAAVKFVQFVVSQKGRQIWVDTTISVPGLSDVVSKHPIIAELSVHDIEEPSFYGLLGTYAKKGENPRKVWDEDNVKLLSGSLTTDEFVTIFHNIGFHAPVRFPSLELVATGSGKVLPL